MELPRRQIAQTGPVQLLRRLCAAQNSQVACVCVCCEGGVTRGGWAISNQDAW